MDMSVDEEPSLLDESQKKRKTVELDRDDEEEDAKDLKAQARKSLLKAVEERIDQSGIDEEDDGINSFSFRPLMRLFAPSKSSSIKPGATGRELKDLLLDTIRRFHKKDARRFFAALKPIVQRVIEEEEYVPDSARADDDGNETTESRILSPEEITPDARSTRALKFLLQATNLLQSYLEAVVDRHTTASSSRKSFGGKTMEIISEAVEVAELLHAILVDLHSCGPEALPVQSAILPLCESWWFANGKQRECLVPNTLLFLVIKALGVDGKEAQKSDIKRLLKIQEAFQEVDFSADSSDLRPLLLKVVSSPLCLKLPEGKRFITGLFLLDADLVNDLHQAIRIQMPQSKKPILNTYGEIYKKAWKDSQKYDCPEEIQAAIEEEVLQDLMYAALHIATPRMAKVLLLVLEPFHEGKKSKEFEGLLHRMYGPILWRALTAANPQVRINAACILGEVFPLQEPNHLQADAAFKRGALAIKALLKDKDPKVREVASEIAAKVLGTYWDVLHTDSIRSLLNIIVTRHSSDATSYKVRVGALNAVTLLLDSPQCHAVLRALLPSLGNLIHDKNKKVRLAAVNMLLKVKTIDGIKYYHVVPVEHLKARLADEGQQSSLNSAAYNPMLYLSDVASGLTRLMMNSFVPQGSDVTAQDQLHRTLGFLHSDPDAAAVFYANLADHLPPKAIAKLASMLLRCLTAAIENEKKNKKDARRGASKKRSRSGNESDSDEESEDEDSSDDEEKEASLLASNTPFMANLAEVIASLWESILEELEDDENESCKNILVRTFSGTTLTDILGYFEKAARADKRKSETRQNDYCRIHSAILRCAGFLEAKDVEGLFAHITKSLQALSSPKMQNQKQKMSTASISDHFALLCLWDMAEDVATSLSSSIVSAFDDVDDLSLLTPVSDTSKKRKSSRGTRRKSNIDNCAIPMLPPEMAMDVLNDLLLGSDPGNVLAREILLATTKSREQLEEAFEATTQYTGRFLRGALAQNQTVNDADFQFLVKVCEAFGRFSLHKAGFNAIEEGTMIELNLEAKHLLEWTSEHVLPAILTEGKGLPLQELDLSRISFGNDDSRMSIELDETLDDDVQSPNMSPLAPPRKKGNRNATPERLDSVFDPAAGKRIGKRKDSKIIPGHSTVTLVRCASSALLQNSCIIFSEWLFAGVDADSGSKEILESALKWCSILEKTAVKEGVKDKENKSSDDSLISFQVLLLPAFARLSVALGVKASDFQLLKVLLQKLPRIFDLVEGQDEAMKRIEKLVRDMVSTLLKSAEAAGAVSAVLDIAYETLPASVPGAEDNKRFELPTDTNEVVGSLSSSPLVSALDAIVSHKNSGLLLAERLVDNIDTKIRSDESSETDDKSVILFEAKCLWFLSDSGACRKAPQFGGILRKLKAFDLSNTDIYGDDKPLGVMFRQMLEGADPPTQPPEDESQTEPLQTE